MLSPKFLEKLPNIENLKSKEDFIYELRYSQIKPLTQIRAKSMLQSLNNSKISEHIEKVLKRIKNRTQSISNPPIFPQYSKQTPLPSQLPLKSALKDHQSVENITKFLTGLPSGHSLSKFLK
jgi:uncharacterized protein YjaZ